MTQSNAMEKSRTCCDPPPASRGENGDQERWAYRPPTDILDCGTEYTILAEVPGAVPDSVTVTFQGDVVTIDAAVTSRSAQGAEMRLQEYGVGDYHRQFNFGDLASSIDEAAITAECANGLLTIHLPRKAAAQPRKIDVKAS